MDYKKLGYTQAWFECGILTEESLKKQLTEFDKEEDQNTEHYRYGSFLNWLNSKNAFTNLEIENYLNIAKQDPDKLMAESAVSQLFTSSYISESQFESLKNKLPDFGNWTEKLINRETLIRRLKQDEISNELVDECINHKITFKENRLIEIIIDQTDRTEILSRFLNSDFGKKTRNLANQKLKHIKKRS